MDKDEAVHFEWSGGTLAPRADPNEVGHELERIRENAGGELHAADVVEAARDKQSVLHGLFLWDDTEAAQRYREEQARSLIRRLRVVRDAEAEQPRVVRVAYVSPAPQKRPGYIPTETAMADPVTRDQVLGNALSALEGWQARYGMLEEIAEEVALLQTAIAKLKRKRKARGG